MATGQGIVALDFGTGQGSNEASGVVTGQTGISAGSKAEAYVMADVTGTHTADDHKYFALFAGLTCGDVVADTGFTVYARCAEKMTGTFNARFVWAD